MRTDGSKEVSAIWHALCILTAMAYISISMHMPVSLYATAGHDDALFIINAQHIVAGDWLGPFSQMTLAKGAAYSIFLATNALLGVPVTLSLAALYLFSCWVFVWVLSSVGLRRFSVFIIFLTLLFQPALFPTRIVRDNIYPSLLLLVIAGIISAGNLLQIDRYRLKNTLFGIALGIFWMTREEGIWILPGIGCYVVYKTIALRKSKEDLKLFFLHLSVYILSALAVPFAISFLNYYHYRTFETVDFKSASFETVLRKLNSVSAGPETPFVPVPHAKRTLIYKASPAFQQLESYFENRGREWTKPGCAIYPQTCGDYAGGWFMWALRDAVTDKGYYSSPQTAKAFYDEISSEVDAACKKGTLICRQTVLPFLPAIPDENLKRIPFAVNEAIQVSTYNITVALTDGKSQGVPRSLQDMRLFLGNPKTAPSDAEQTTDLAGWYHSPGNDWPSLDCLRDGKSITNTITRMESPDIAAHFRDDHAIYQRFSITLRKSDECKFVLNGQKYSALPVSDILTNASSVNTFGDGTLFLDIRRTEGDTFAKPLRLKQHLADAYHWISPALTCVGAIAFIVILLMSLVKKRPPPELFWIAGMLWILYLVRLALVVLVDISSFPAINFMYLAPIFPVVYAASILSIELLTYAAKTSDSV